MVFRSFAVFILFFLFLALSLNPIYSDDMEPFTLDIRIMKQGISDGFLTVRILVVIVNHNNESYSVESVKPLNIVVLNDKDDLLLNISESINISRIYPGENKIYDSNITIYIDDSDKISFQVFSGTYLIKDHAEYNLSGSMSYDIVIRKPMRTTSHKNMHIGVSLNPPTIETPENRDLEKAKPKITELNATLVIGGRGVESLVLFRPGIRGVNVYDALIYFYLLAIIFSIIFTYRVVRLIFS